MFRSPLGSCCRLVGVARTIGEACKVALVQKACDAKCGPAVTFWRSGVGLCMRSGNAARAPDLGQLEGDGSFPASDHPRRETARIPASCGTFQLVDGSVDRLVDFPD